MSLSRATGLLVSLRHRLIVWPQSALCVLGSHWTSVADALAPGHKNRRTSYSHLRLRVASEGAARC
jgi:hypothetical protein